MGDGNRQQIVVVAERMVTADPARVWALIADPSRVAEWAGVAMVGYMGTELPKPGQTVFVRRGRFGKTWRVNIDAWDAGSSVRCLLESDKSEGVVRFELAIHPQVTADAIVTKVRLSQRMEASRPFGRLVHTLVASELNKKIDRIAKAAVR
ncbi:MAG: SRPBCC family protein [bacterium]|nr:SRPBCC family protein [bacterium]